MSLEVNDVPTHVTEWRIAQSVSQTLSFYRELLGDRRVELDLSPGRLLAAPINGKFVTVQLLANSAQETRARISESSLQAAGRSPEDIPLPPQMSVLTRVGTRDPAGNARTFIARSVLDLDSSARSLRGTLAAAGYGLSEQSRIEGGTSGLMLRFAGHRRRVEIVLTPRDGGTWIAAVSSETGP